MKLRLLTTCLCSLAVSLSALAYRVDTVAVSGSGLAEPMKALVVVPDSANAQHRMPTVYLLHGYSGSHLNWMEKQPRIGDYADRYGLIVVTPDAKNSWYFDAPDKPDQQYETFFINSLIPYIDVNYPTIADGSKRAITGLSMGGHGSLYLSGRHPGTFGAAGTISGGVDIRKFPNNWKIAAILGSYEEHPERWEQNAVATMIPQLKASGMALIVDCGVDDIFAEVNENLHRDLLAAGVPHDYYSRPGGHSWKYWDNAVLYHLLFFSEFFNANK